MKSFKILFFLFVFWPQFNSAQRFFDNVDQYLIHTIERTDFDRSKVIIENFTENEDFITDLTSNHLFTFYGIAYNDELYSASQLQNKSCWGQFLALCKSIKEGGSTVILNNKKITEVSYLKNIKFNKNKKTILFIYSSELRKGQVKTFIKTIKKEIDKDDSYDYVVLSLDYYKIINH